MKTARITSNPTWKASVLLAFFFVTPSFVDAWQNPKSIDARKLAVDVVSVRKVGRMCGIVLDQDEQSLSIVVRRDWLKESYPEFWQQHLAAETKELESARETIKQRIAEWREEYKGDDAAVVGEFLDNNEKLLELDKPVDVSKLAFTIVNLNRDQVGRVYAQTSDKHQLAGVAWSEKIEGVEHTSARVLQRKLKKNKVDVAGYDLKLGNEIPPMSESDEKWQARKALVEFSLLSRVEFQGTGTMFFQRGKTPTAAQAMQGVLSGGGFSQIDKLGKELGLPEFQDRGSNKRDDNESIAPMIEAAEKANRRSFSVSILEQGQTVKVKTKLYFRALDTRWYPLKEFSNSERLSDQKMEEIDGVKQDPQVAQMLKMMGQLGAGVDASILDQAMRSGVATKKALAKSMSELDEFVDQYSFEIDNPPVQK